MLTVRFHSQVENRLFPWDNALKAIEWYQQGKKLEITIAIVIT